MRSAICVVTSNESRLSRAAQKKRPLFLDSSPRQLQAQARQQPHLGILTRAQSPTIDAHREGRSLGVRNEGILHISEHVRDATKRVTLRR